MQEKEGPIQFVNYYIHHVCNLNCPYCRVKERNIKPMDKEERREALTRLGRLTSSIKILSLLGGEPTLNKNFLLDVVADGIDAGFYVTLVTNGYGLDTNLIDEIYEANHKKEGGQRGMLGQIAVSVDCGSSDKTDLKEAMRLLSYARSKGIVPVVNTVLTSRTDVNDFMGFVGYITAKGIFVNPMACSASKEGGSFSNALSEDCPTPTQLRLITPWLAWKKYSTGYITATFGYLWTLFKSSFSKDHTVWNCSPNFRSEKTLGRGFLTLDSDGYIGPCQEFPRVVNILKEAPEQLTPQSLDDKFKDIIKKCPGCAYNCYINEGSMRSMRLGLEELITGLPMIATLQMGDKLHNYREGSRIYPFKDITMLFQNKKTED